MSHNMHNLSHICADVRKYGPFDDFNSCFTFENHMQLIKKLIRKGDEPLQQLARRFQGIDMIESMMGTQPSEPQWNCEREHHDGLILEINVKLQYKRMSKYNIFIRCDDKNSCCLLANGRYMSIVNIIARNNGELFVTGKQLSFELWAWYSKLK